MTLGRLSFSFQDMNDQLKAAVKELKYRGLVPGSNDNKGKWNQLSVNYLLNGEQICVVEDTSHNASFLATHADA